MARLARMVLPGVPHHVTQRGNRRERTFFEEGDYALYLDLLADAAERHGVEVWSYCLGKSGDSISINGCRRLDVQNITSR